MARPQRSPLDAERRRLEASTDTEGAIYRANLKGRLHDTKPYVALARAIRFEVASEEDYQPLPQRYLPIARLEDQPRLDLRSLAAHGFLEKRSELRLVWDKPKLDVFIITGERVANDPFTVLVFKQEGLVTRQIIDLTPRPGPGRHRYKFIIPGYGLAEVLAYRGHRFAPPSLQRLVYSSQRKPKIEPAAKLEARLLKRASAKSKPA